LLASASACGGEGTLFVHLKTDLIAVEEITTVDTELFDEEPDDSDRAPPWRFEETRLERSSALATGIRVAAFEGLDEGTDFHVRMRLFDRRRRELVKSLALIRMEVDRAVTILVTRDCRGVACTAGQSCLGGRCASTRCTGGAAGECPTLECDRNADCPAPNACADRRCDQGTCLATARTGICDSDEYCDPERGCIAAADNDPDAGATTDAASANDGAVVDASSGP
jgi:hypothetical protein